MVLIGIKKAREPIFWRKAPPTHAILCGFIGAMNECVLFIFKFKLT